MSDPTMKLPRRHFSLIEYALQERLKVWRRTEQWWRQYEAGVQWPSVDGEIEECSGTDEAERMCALFEEVLDDLSRVA